MRSCSEAYDRKLEDLKEDMEAMLQVADVVWQYDFCGGETFLYDNDALAYLVDKACGAPKVLSVLLVTNGTIIPTEGLLKSLGHSKVSVFVSNYGELSSQYSALVGLFQERGIKHTPRGREGDEAWRDFGLHDTKRERPDKFHCEAMFGTSLIDGRLYRCGVSAFMSRLGFVKENPAEYIQVRGRDPRDIRAELSSFYAQTYLSACDYCDGVTGTPVKAAEQCAIS